MVREPLSRVWRKGYENFAFIIIVVRGELNVSRKETEEPMEALLSSLDHEDEITDFIWEDEVTKPRGKAKWQAIAKVLMSKDLYQ